MEKVNGGQEWTPSSISHLTHAIKLGGKKGIRFEATWQKPVERSGPWHFIHCQGLRKSVSAARWSGLIRMSLYVDLENRSVVGYAWPPVTMTNHKPPGKKSTSMLQVSYWTW